MVAPVAVFIYYTVEDLAATVQEIIDHLVDDNSRKCGEDAEVKHPEASRGTGEGSCTCQCQSVQKSIVSQNV
jgi:hypothetical protein